METTTVNPFSDIEIVRWLGRNSLHRAIDCFNDGCREIDNTRDRADRDCLDIVLCATAPESWIGCGFSCMVKQQRVWFASPLWKQTEWTQVAQKAHPHLMLGGAVPEVAFVNVSKPEGPASEDPGVMIPTGGSSGDIKFAWHTLDTVTQAVNGMSRFFLGRDVQRGDFCYACDLPLWHISGWMQLMRAYLSDSTWLQEQTAILPTEKQGYRWLSLVPTQLARLLESGSIDVLRAADFIVIGGGACPVHLLREAMRVGLSLWVTYGMTETAGMIAGKQIRNEDDLELGAQVFPHCDISIDAAVGASGDDNWGEICVRSRSLCLGYDGERFREPGLFPTGDIGSLDADHRLHVRGRMDAILNTGGEKVFPTEVQEIMSSHPAVSDCRVFGVDDSEWGTKIACVYATHDGESLDPTMLKQHVSSKLSSYKVPKIWRHVESLPYDSKGKISVSALINLIAGDAEKS